MVISSCHARKTSVGVACIVVTSMTFNFHALQNLIDKKDLVRSKVASNGSSKNEKVPLSGQITNKTLSKCSDSGIPEDLVQCVGLLHFLLYSCIVCVCVIGEAQVQTDLQSYRSTVFQPVGLTSAVLNL